MYKTYVKNNIMRELTLRKSKVSALTVSACNFFPPAACPETTPMPLASVAVAAGAGEGAGAAGAGRRKSLMRRTR